LKELRDDVLENIPKLKLSHPNLAIDTVHHCFPAPSRNHASSSKYTGLINAAPYHVENDLKPDCAAAQFPASQRKMVQEIAFAFNGMCFNQLIA
jgi:hypothetical protein